MKIQTLTCGRCEKEQFFKKSGEASEMTAELVHFQLYTPQGIFFPLCEVFHVVLTFMDVNIHFSSININQKSLR